MLSSPSEFPDTSENNSGGKFNCLSLPKLITTPTSVSGEKKLPPDVVVVVSNVVVVGEDSQRSSISSASGQSVSTQCTTAHFADNNVDHKTNIDSKNYTNNKININSITNVENITNVESITKVDNRTNVENIANIDNKNNVDNKNDVKVKTSIPEICADDEEEGDGLFLQPLLPVKPELTLTNSG